jgi:hypothetical protein
MLLSRVGSIVSALDFRVVFWRKGLSCEQKCGLDLIIYPAARCLSLADWEMIYFFVSSLSFLFSLSPSFAPC